jgi:hypothetical protein
MAETKIPRVDTTRNETAKRPTAEVIDTDFISLQAREAMRQLHAGRDRD